jgi:hypothetical protein
MTLSSDLISKKIPVFTGINDQPKVPTVSAAGNGSHLIKTINDLIDLLSSDELISTNKLIDVFLSLIDTNSQLDVSKTNNNTLLIKDKKTVIYSLLKLILQSTANNSLNLLANDTTEKIDISLNLDNLFGLIASYLAEGSGITLNKNAATKVITINSSALTSAVIYPFIKAMLLSGSNASITPNDTNKTLTIASTASGGGSSINQETLLLITGKGVNGKALIKDDNGLILSSWASTPVFTNLNPPFGAGTTSINFQGVSSFLYSSPIPFTNSYGWSFECFIRAFVDPAEQIIFVLSDDLNPGDQGQRWLVKASLVSGNLIFSARETQVGAITTIQTTTAPIAQNVWTYICFGIEEFGNMKIRVGNSELKVSASSTYSGISANHLVIGGWARDDSQNFGTLMSNIRVSPRSYRFSSPVPTAYFAN